MAVGALLQAEGCPRFRERLLGTSGKGLVEAKPYDAWWGVGMSAAEADRVPVAARKMAWGRNEHGVALMLARAALERAASAPRDG